MPPFRLPLLPTLVVGAAVTVMIALGIWQLGRAEWKNDLIARYGEAQALGGAVPWPRTAQAVETGLYRPSAVICDRVLDMRATAGRSASGRSGWAHMARCALDGGGEAEIALGWSQEPRQPLWNGGPATGVVAPSGGAADGGEARLVAIPALAGLEQLARPDPSDLPNNHLSYAVQWFFFAATALAVYVLALRRKRTEPK